MSDAFKDVSTVPTLTTGTVSSGRRKETGGAIGRTKADDTILTEEERRW